CDSAIERLRLRRDERSQQQPRSRSANDNRNHERMRTGPGLLSAAAYPGARRFAAGPLERRPCRRREIARWPSGHSQLWTWRFRIYVVVGLRPNRPGADALINSSVAASLCEAREIHAAAITLRTAKRLQKKL